MCGILEISSIAKGIEVLDAIVKQSPVEVLKADVFNPGKYFILIMGEVAEVDAALKTGIEVADKKLLDHVFLKNLNAQVLPAMECCFTQHPWDAIGLLETCTIASAVEAADTAVKIADIKILEIATGNELGGKALLKISGPIGDIETAMNSVVSRVRDKCQLYSDVIIPRPHKDIKGFVYGN